MKQSEARALIQDGIRASNKQRWADLGCGSGTFTNALASLLPASSQIIAIDQSHQSFTDTAIEFLQANFVSDILPLNQLDGILMANSFHYVADKVSLIEKLEKCFISAPTFLFVEYDTTNSNRWVPYPISFQKLEAFFNLRGYNVKKLADYASSFGGTMYAAIVTRI